MKLTTYTLNSGAIIKPKFITLKGISRAPYAFSIYPWGLELPSTCAVYAVLHKSRHGYTVLFINTTCDLTSHLAGHSRREEFDREGCTHIGVYVEPLASRRHASVKDLIASYMPKLNLANDS